MQGCGTFTEDKIRLVLGMDGRPTGEAYVEISGPGAKLRLALSRDRQIMPVRHAILSTPLPLVLSCSEHSPMLSESDREALLGSWLLASAVQAASQKRACEW